MSVWGDIEDALGGTLSSVLAPVKALIRKAVGAVAGWAQDVFHLVGGAWDAMVTGADHLLIGGEQLAESVWHLGGKVLHIYLPELANWAGHYIDLAEQLARNAEHALFLEIGRAEQLAQQLVSNAVRWIEANLVAPLVDRLAHLERFIGSEMGPAVDLLLHPGKLVELIGSWVTEHVVDTLDALGGPVFRWFRRSAVHDARAVAAEIEQLIASVL